MYTALLIGLGFEKKSKKGEVISYCFIQALKHDEEISPSRSDLLQIFKSFGYKGGNQTINFKGCNVIDLLQMFHKYAAVLKLITIAVKNDLLESMVITIIEKDDEIKGLDEIHLKLTACQAFLFSSNELSFEGMDKYLVNVHWTNRGAIALDELDEQIDTPDVKKKPLNHHSTGVLPLDLLNYVPDDILFNT